MTKQRLVLNKLLEEYRCDRDVRGVILFGSVSRGDEKENSDIDLWVCRYTDKFKHSILKKDGVKIDLFEISIPMLERFLDGREPPAINAILDGTVVLNKDVDFEALRESARRAKSREFIPISTMPENRIINILLQYKTLAEDAKDVIDDKMKYRLVFSELIAGLYNNIYDFYGIWRESSKNTLEVFRREAPKMYEELSKMLDDTLPRELQVHAAETIIDILAEPYGGLPETWTITEIVNKDNR